MLSGSGSVFVGSGICLTEEPGRRARGVVEAVTYYKEPKKLAEISEGLGQAMGGLEIGKIAKEDQFAHRGW